MFQIFSKIKESNILNEKIINVLTIIEYIQILFAIEFIFPIKNEYNYYFPLYFLSPYIYVEFAKDNDYTKTIENTAKSQAVLKKDNENVIYYIANKYLKSIPSSNKSFNFFRTSFLLACMIFLGLVFLAFIILIFFNENKKNSKNKPKKSYVKDTCIVMLYIVLKPLLGFFLYILSNFLVPKIFFGNVYKPGIFGFAACMCFVLYFVISNIFIEFFLIGYSFKIAEQFSFCFFEKFKLLNKLLISLLFHMSNFDTLNIYFFRIICFVALIYQHYIYFKNMREGLINTKADFYLSIFLFTFICIRFLNFLGVLLYGDVQANNRSYQILLLLLNLSTFCILIIHFREIIKKKLSKNLFNRQAKIPVNLALIMSKYIDNVFSNCNVNIFMNNLDLKDLVKNLKDHKTNCINNNNINCDFCTKFDFKKINNDNKEILKIILNFIETSDKTVYGKEEKDYLILNKLILIYILDDFKIHRLSYFIIKSFKVSSYKLSLILNFIYEKLIIRNMKDDDPNYILLNYVQLNEYFLKAIKISLDFNEELREKSKSLKKIIQKNQEFGSLYNMIHSNLKNIHLNMKNFDKSNLYKYLWCFNLIYNKNFEDDILLDLPENIELIDQSIFKFSFFLLNYHFDANTWTFKKIPFIYIKNFGFNNKEMFGKNFDSVFPPLLKNFESKKLEEKFRYSSISKFSINTYLISKKSLIKNVDLTFDILPALYENSFIISNIVNYNLNKKDNVIMVDRDGIIIYTSEIPQAYLGISNKLIISHKELVSLVYLLNLKDFRSSSKMPETLIVDLAEYFKNYTNLYIYEPTMKDNIEELDIKEFYNFFQKAKVLMQKKKIIVTLDLFEERNNFYFYKCNLTESLTHKQKSETRKFDENHILNFFNNNNENNENSQNNIDDTKNYISIDKYQDQNTLSLRNSSGLSDSTGRDYFSSINRSNNTKLLKENETIVIFSRIIWIYNFTIALLGLIFLIYINFISAEVLNKYSVVKGIRIINSNYMDCMTHLVQLIVLNDSNEYDSLIRKAKLENANIKMNFSTYLHNELRKKSDKVFKDRESAYSNFINFIDLDFLKQKIDTNTTSINMNGILNIISFMDFYKQFSNLIYKVSLIEEYYIKIPFTDVSDQTRLIETFRNLDEKERIIINLMYNYRFMSKKFKELDHTMEEYFENIYIGFENKVYYIFVIIILVHLISIVLSFFELTVLQKKLLKQLNQLLLIRKKELEYINFKLKSAENLVDLENKPSEIIEELKVKKNEIKRYLNHHLRLKKNINTQRYGQKSNLNATQKNTDFILDYNTKSFKKDNKESKESTNKNNDSSEKKELIKENENLMEQNSHNKRVAKAEIYLKKNKKHFFEYIFSTIKILFLIIFSYLLYAVLLFVIIENGFKNINISSEYIKQIVEVERLSVNYLISLKLSIAFNDTQSNILSNDFEKDPNNIYISFNRIDNLITNYNDMKLIREYMSQLKDKNICAVVLKNDIFITDTSIIDNICAFCDTNMIFSFNEKIIISYFVQNMRSLYLSYIKSNKRKDSIGNIYNSDVSQLINYIFLFFIRPFIRTTKDDYGFKIYNDDLIQMVYNSFIFFGLITVLDVINFLIMKRNIANKIEDMLDNFKNICISMSMA